MMRIHDMIRNLKSSTGVHILLLSALSLATFWGTLGHDFVTTWDDDKYVVTNEVIRNLSVENIRAAFGRFFLGNYAPLQILSYMADYQLFRLNPWGYHLHNIVLQILNGIMCYWLFLKVSGKKEVALLAAYIFLLHPVQVETVAWISQRKNLLCMFFFLPSLIFYLMHRESNRWGYYWLSLACFLLSLLVKPVSVVLPAILLAYDTLVARRRFRETLPDKIPFALLALLFILVALKSQLPEQGGGRAGFYGGSWYATLLTMIPVFCRYLLNVVWPLRLSADYLIPIRTGLDATVLLSVVPLVVLAGLLLRLGKTGKELLFWPAVAVLALVPVSQIVPIVTLMNDRYLYFPMVGISPLIALGTIRLFRWPPAGTTIAIVIAMWLISLPFMSHRQAATWKNGITLWQSVLERQPGNYLAITSLADSYREAGNPDQALRLYRNALSLNPDYFMALNNFSTLLLNTGNAAEAKPHIERLVTKYPGFARGHEMLGLERELAGDMAAAEAAYRKALDLDPNLVESNISMAAILLKRGDLNRAEQLLLTAREQDGDSPEVAYSMACLQAGKGKPREAVAELQKVARSGAIDITAALIDPCFAPISNDKEFKLLTGKR